MTTDKKCKHTKSSRKTDEEPELDILNEEAKAVKAAEEAEKAKAAEETQKEAKKPKKLTPQEKITELEIQLAETQDKILRTHAEFMNYRKRTAKEIANARMFGLTDTITPFLQVFDHFNMAVMAAENSDNMDAIRQGLEMILGEYEKALDELNVERFEAKGKAFDPELHEAVAHESSDEIPENHVLKQWSCGYKMGERLLRPATVVVSSGPAAAEKEDASDEKSEEQ
ncbi:MAG: nucleotide exchange factor GrpE [Lentisphaerae bacterium]|nr:nucleotide exchange factor GrpE [Lentisphaerota bacterium]MCP4100310.1 nucleotide exchange factor GrpE [Lentisphaerota bacterium]